MNDAHSIEAASNVNHCERCNARLPIWMCPSRVCDTCRSRSPESRALAKETIASIASATTASDIRAAWDSMIWHPSGFSPMGALKAKVEQAERARAIALLGWLPETPENGGRYCASMHELLLSLEGR